MGIIDLIKKRRSVRKYKAKTVPQSSITKLLDAANWAPTAGNIQPWRFILITSKEKMQALARLCQNQEWISTAPLAIVLVADARDMYHAYGVRGTRLYAVQECGAAAQNLLLTATELGLGACWISSFDEAALMTMCKIPDHARPQAVITVGYPQEVGLPPKRRELHDLYYIEEYGKKEAEKKDLFPLGKHKKPDLKEKIHKSKQKLLKRLKQTFR